MRSVQCLQCACVCVRVRVHVCLCVVRMLLSSQFDVLSISCVPGHVLVYTVLVHCDSVTVKAVPFRFLSVQQRLCMASSFSGICGGS